MKFKLANMPCSIGFRGRTCDSSFTFNTQCSSQQVPSFMPITHLAHPPTHLPPATLSLFCVFKTLVWFASLFLFFFFFFFFKFIYLSWGGRGRDRKGERENPRQALHCQHRAQHRARIMNPEIMNWAKIKSQMLNQLSLPGMPFLTIFILFFFSLSYVHLFCFLNSTYECNHMMFVFLWLNFT